jgi:hypothetical protein
MCNQICKIHHQHFLINFYIKQWKTNEKIHYKWNFCFGRVKFGINNGNYTRIQCWLCITKNGDCERRNRHLLEGRSRAVFIFIAGDCTGFSLKRSLHYSYILSRSALFCRSWISIFITFSSANSQLVTLISSHGRPCSAGVELAYSLHSLVLTHSSYSRTDSSHQRFCTLPIRKENQICSRC